MTSDTVTRIPFSGKLGAFISAPGLSVTDGDIQFDLPALQQDCAWSKTIDFKFFAPPVFSRFFLRSFLCLLSSLPNFANGSTKKVFIDPGHGGQDTGAHFDGIKEAQLTLELARLVKDELDGKRGVEALLTRNSNTELALVQRAQMANEGNADLFVSLHFNSSPNTAVSGLEVYFQNQLTTDEDSMQLAAQENGEQVDDRGIEASQFSGIPSLEKMTPIEQTILVDALKNRRIEKSSRLARRIFDSWHGNRRHRFLSIRQAPFFVVSHVKMPSVLIEAEYLSNSQARKSLSQERLRLMAKNIAMAIEVYLKENYSP